MKIVKLIFIIHLILLFTSCDFLPLTQEEYEKGLSKIIGSVILISPGNNSIITDTTPLLQWEINSNANYYYLQVSKNKDFYSNLTIDQDSVTENQFQIKKPLDNDTSYYWRVRVRDDKGRLNSWSDVWKFSIKITIPDNPSPANGSLCYTQPITLGWNNLDFAQYYHLQLSTDPGFSGTLLGDVNNLENNQYTIISSLATITKYYWRIRTSNYDGLWSEWSNTWYFVYINETKIIASDGDTSDFFGYSVSISTDGNTIVTGATWDEDNGDDSGSIYIYKRNGSVWNETKIIASDGDSYEYFGKSVSISEAGNTIVVGAYRDDDNDSDSGSIYIYEFNGSIWGETKIIASDGGYSDYFGESVSISADGNTIVAGASYDDDNGGNSGSIYIYKWNSSSWDETKILASDGDNSDYFGSSVSVSEDGNEIVTGAHIDEDNGVGSGSIYIYKWDGSVWEETKIIASDGDYYDRFGESVSISADGNTIVVGASDDNDNGSDSGSIYIYKWNSTSWDETKIMASDGDSNDNFGGSVSISGNGNTIIVGAIGDENDDEYGYDLGSIYIYKWNGISWNETKIISSDISDADYFGYSISISGDGNTIVSGARDDDDNGYDSGSIYIYE